MSSVKRNTYFIASSQAVNLVLALFLNIMAGRYLGDEGFGKYAFAAVLYYFVFLFDDFGIVTYVTRAIARNRQDAARYVTNSAVLKLLLILVSGGFLGLYLIVFSFPYDKTVLIILFGVYGILYSFNQLCSGVFRGFEQMHYEMYVVVLEKILITGAGIFVLATGRGLIAFGAVFACAGGVSLIVNLLLVRYKFRIQWSKLSFTFMGSMFKAAVIMGLFLLLAQAHARIDVLLLSAVKGDAVAGWYAAPYKVLLFLEVIPTVLFTSTFPRLSRSFLSDRGYVERIYTIGFKYLFLIALPVVVGAQFLAPGIMALFGSDFVHSVPVLRIVIIAAGFNFFNIFTGGLLIASDRQKDVLKIQAAGLVLNLVINALLIPRYAHIGSSIATLASYGSVLAVTLVVTKKQVCWLARKDFFIKGAAATACMTVFLMFARFSLVPQLVLAMAVYSAAIIAFKGIRLHEVLYIKQVRTGDPNEN